MSPKSNAQQERQAKSKWAASATDSQNAMSATPSAPNPHVPQLLSARSPVIIRPLAKDGMSAAPLAPPPRLCPKNGVLASLRRPKHCFLSAVRGLGHLLLTNLERTYYLRILRIVCKISGQQEGFEGFVLVEICCLFLKIRKKTSEGLPRPPHTHPSSLPSALPPSLPRVCSRLRGGCTCMQRVWVSAAVCARAK